MQPEIFLAVWPGSLFPASSVLLVVLFIQLCDALDQENEMVQDPSYTRMKDRNEQLNLELPNPVSPEEVLT